MKTFLQILKSILKASLLWTGLTIVALTIDSIFHLSEKSEGFTFLFVTAPLIVAAWSPSKKLIQWAWEYRKSRSKNPKPITTVRSKTVEMPAAVRPSPRSTSMARIDTMEGHAFEEFVANLLRKLGYENVKVTPGSGDQGVDVIAMKDDKKYAIQCKRYSQKLGNKPVQEVHAGKTIYGCNVAVVITNNYFTDGGKEAAQALGVELWDRDILRRMITYADFKVSA